MLIIYKSVIPYIHFCLVLIEHTIAGIEKTHKTEDKKGMIKPKKYNA
jgi:hypothetical protein